MPVSVCVHMRAIIFQWRDEPMDGPMDVGQTDGKIKEGGRSGRNE